MPVGPNDPSSAYPPPGGSATQLTVAAPATEPEEDANLLLITDAASAPLVTFTPWYTDDAVTGGDLIVRSPNGQQSIDTEFGESLARVTAMDASGGDAYGQVGCDHGNATCLAHFGTNVAQLQAWADGAMLFVNAPTGQVGAGNAIVQISRGGFPMASIYGNGDIKIFDSTAGLILSSPNGMGHRLTVNNAGELQITDVAYGDEGGA